jgi:hypothetical protein
MSERERWIVYPLLFFALGAALRDKFTHSVRTDDLYAGRVWCEELNVVDSEKPDRIVAKLTSNQPQRGRKSQDRFGVFVLIDSENREFCSVTNNQLFVRDLIGQTVSVVDPQNAAMPLAQLRSTQARGADGKSKRLGTLVLTDSEGREQFGLRDDLLHMRQIVCEGVAVIDREKPGRILAGLGSELARAEGEDADRQRVGVLALNGQPYISVQGNRLHAPAAETPEQPGRNPGDAGGRQ